MFHVGGENNSDTAVRARQGENYVLFPGIENVSVDTNT